MHNHVVFVIGVKLGAAASAFNVFFRHRGAPLPGLPAGLGVGDMGLFGDGSGQVIEKVVDVTVHEVNLYQDVLDCCLL